MRCVSLLPSATELVALIAEHAEPDAIQIVGRSHECDFPPGLESLPALTSSRIAWTNSEDVDKQVREELEAGNSLYSVDRALLASLLADAVITQSLCKVCSVDFCAVQSIAAGLDPAPLVVDLNPQSLQEVIGDVRRVGGLLGQPAAGEAAAAALEARVAAAVARVPQGVPEEQRPSVSMLEWTKPIFVGGHWTPQLVEMAGGRHPLNPTKDGGGAGNSFVVSTQALADSEPEWVVVALCGLGLPKTRHEVDTTLADDPVWQGMRAVRERRVLLVDGNAMFNRPGPRLVDALEFLVALLHGGPAAIQERFPWEYWREPANRARPTAE